MRAIGDWWSGRLFRMVHGRNLVYNTCWEDPRLDRQALELSGGDRVLMITSAGCNALDYVLDEPERIDAVDVNPRQNALLELKIAGIRQLEFEDFFAMFGRGRLPHARKVYEDRLRPALSDWSRRYWDRWIVFFDNPRRSFYYRGASGMFAQLVKFYIDRVLKVRDHVNALFEASSLEEQRRIYEQHLRHRFWTRPLRFVMNRDMTLSMVGVPRAQRRQVEQYYAEGVVQFVRDCLDAVFGQLPLTDNYFWRVYLGGCYTPACCPEYLKPGNFQRLKEGLVDRIHIATDSVRGLLEVARQRIERRGWTNVEVDVTTFWPGPEPVDVVTFSYSLTMIPDWFTALDHARSLLRACGTIGVVDFYVSRKIPHPGRRRHGWWTRTVWPIWFARDNVHLSPDHVPFLLARFDTVQFREHLARVPYLPLARVPYYTFVGSTRGGDELGFIGFRSPPSGSSS